MMEILKEETPNFFTIMLRKPFKVKVIETMVFIFLIVILSAKLGYSNPYFKISAVISAILSVSFTPIYSKFFMKTKYVLTKNEVVIRKNDSETKISLYKISQPYDMHHMIKVDGKKITLGVSDDFIVALENRLRAIKGK